MLNDITIRKIDFIEMFFRSFHFHLFRYK